MATVPDFSWSEAAGRYRNRDTGQWVSEREVRTGVDALVSHASDNIVWRAGALRAGTIDVVTFQSELQQTIKDVHVASALAAYGGRDAMTPARWGYVGSRIKAQYKYGRRFVTQMMDGRQPLNGRVEVRSAMYAEAGRVTYEAIRAREAKRRGFEEERNILHANESCRECIAETAKGWVTAGKLKPVGRRLCLTRCKCTIDRRGTAA